MGLGKSLKKAVKKATKVISSPTRTVAATFTGGLSELTGVGDKISDSSWSRYTDALGYALAAYVAAPALMGEAGAASTPFGTSPAGQWAASTTGAGTVSQAASMAGSTAGATSATGAGIGAGTAAIASGSTYLGYKQMVDVQKAAKDQARAILQAQQSSEQANREAEILRKQALLASQKSITARKAAASAVANKLKNTNVSYLGGDEEKLGG